MTPPLFVAVPVPAAIAEGLAAWGGGIPGARWTPAENMHVTLRYLGELEEPLAGEVAAVLGELKAGAFTVRAEGVDFFGRHHGPRLLYAGVRPRDDLLELRRRMETRFRRLGLAPDGRRYHPHITLARLKGAAPAHVGRFVEGNGLAASPPFEVGSFALFESHRHAEGSVYRRRKDYGLQNRRTGERQGEDLP